MGDSPEKYVRSHILPERAGLVKLGEPGKEFKTVETESLTVTGSATIGTLALTALGTLGTGVTSADAGGSASRQTVLTLVDVVVPVVSVTTGAGIGGALLFTFPANQVQLFGTTADLTISIAAVEQANFEATPEGDLGLGSVIITDPTAFSTDATDDDYSAGVAFTMAAGFTDDVALTSQAGALLAASAEVNVNVFVDAADIDDGASSEVLINGTVVLTWANLGAA